MLLLVLTRSLAAALPAAQQLSWLDQAPLVEGQGSSLGAAWPRGSLPAGSEFALLDAEGRSLPLQTWVLATWPDGSLKWTGHAFVAGPATRMPLSLAPGRRPEAPASPVRVTESSSGVEVDTGVLKAVLSTGPGLVRSLSRAGVEVSSAGSLVLHTRSAPSNEPGATVTGESFHGEVTRLVVEQSGPVRAVVRAEGIHRSDTGGRAWLPFTVRLYFHAGSESVRLLHTIVFDGDENRDFISGLGLRFEVPMRDALHDRHVRLADHEGGLVAEAVRGITGLRRDPGQAVRSAQVEGRALPPVADWVWDRRETMHLQYVPAWGDYTLYQANADGFTVRKRTKPGHGWIDVSAGSRSDGAAYVGGVSGGLTLAIRDFWRKHPAQLDIRNAAGDKAELTAWLWAPDAAPMDLRFYHDGMGMDTFEKQIQGLNITYEDYEPGFGSPYGVARSSELWLWVHEATPSRATSAALGRLADLPPQAAARPSDTLVAGVFGLWSLPDRSEPRLAELEDRNEALLAHYRDEIEARRWYGFWNYGDVMHSYDTDRQVWRYDVGGYAWDNSELSPDLWLWYSYLRTGKAATFRMAEAMSRHTGEVDVHHLGRFKGLGSRHNVQHWGCSAKQMRISNAAYRRFHYFLTADERIGDLLSETVHSAESFMQLDPLRKVRGKPIPPPQRDAVSVNFGTDWGAYSAALLTQWERSGDPAFRTRLEQGMRTIGAQPRGFFTGMGFMNIDTSAFARSKEPGLSVSHLSAVFGLPEMCAELLELIPEPGFEKAWTDYCRLYNAPAEQQREELGERLRGTSLTQGHSRLTAWAALHLRDRALMDRAWSEFLGRGLRDSFESGPVRVLRVGGHLAPGPVSHVEGLSTNGASQWGLALIQVLSAEARLKAAGKR